MGMSISKKDSCIPLFASDILGEEAEKARRPKERESWYERDWDDEKEDFYEEVENDDHKGVED